MGIVFSAIQNVTENFNLCKQITAAVAKNFVFSVTLIKIRRQLS